MTLKKKFWICSAITLALLGTAASALYHNTELGHLISQKSYYDFSDGTFTTEETYKKSNLIQNPDGSSVVYEDNYGFLISSVTHTNPENVSITESLYSKEQDSNRTAPNTFRKVSEIYDKKGTLLVRCEVSAIFDCTQLPATVSDLTGDITYTAEGYTVSDCSFAASDADCVLYRFTLSQQDTSNQYTVQLSSDARGTIS